MNDELDREKREERTRDAAYMFKHGPDGEVIKTVEIETDATDDPLCPFIAYPAAAEGPICMGFTREEAAKRLGRALGVDQVFWVHGGARHWTIIL